LNVEQYILNVKANVNAKEAGKQKMTEIIMSEATPQIPSISTPSKTDRPPVTVSKPTPYIFDLGHLLAIDPNPLSPSPSTSNISSSEEILKTAARDGAQSLLNELLTTRPITSSPSGLTLSLPPTTTPLPRWKVLPKIKPPTKWEAFARKKGIGKFGGTATGGAKLEDRRKNMVYDEESGEWVKKWGYKGKNKEGEGSDWLVELDEKRVRAEKDREGGQEAGQNVRMEGKRERMERVRRQERKERSNAKRGGKKTRA
jgi:regulator of ribosome biosynthesis